MRRERPPGNVNLPPLTPADEEYRGGVLPGEPSGSQRSPETPHDVVQQGRPKIVCHVAGGNCGGFPDKIRQNLADWVYEGDVVVIDLNFGNYSRRIPNFKCGNYVIDWVQEDGAEGGDRIYRENYDIAECEE